MDRTTAAAGVHAATPPAAATSPAARRAPTTAVARRRARIARSDSLAWKVLHTLGMAPSTRARTSARAAAFALTAATAGCVHDYHPEDRPETDYAVLREEVRPVVALHGSERALAAVPDPLPPGQPAPAASAPVDERWIEHAKGTACDRALAVDASGAAPRVTVDACDPEDTSRIRLVTEKRAGDDWVLRVDRDAANPREKCVEYRLRRRADGAYCGSLVPDGACGRRSKGTPVCWTREGAPSSSPATTPAWLAGSWRQQTDGAPCDDAVRVEADDGKLSAVEHGCFALDHLDTTRLRATLDDDGGVQVFDDAADGARHYRLTRADDGSLRGEVVEYPSKWERGARPTIKGVRWVRP